MLNRLRIGLALISFMAVITACAPTSTAEPPPPPAIDTSNQAANWPVYTLSAELPDTPSQMTLYRQVVPAGLPNEERLAEIMEQLQMTGTVSTNTTEAGEGEISVTGDSGTFRLSSDDPLLLVIENGPPSQPATEIPLETRVEAAQTFLNARNLLDFPHLMEPPRMSRERDRAIRVVPLIDGYPLHDYDPLNGRLLVLFNTADEIAAVFWRPLKIVAEESVDIVPANVIWEQLVNGDTPTEGTIGHCWQTTVFDPKESYGVATPLNSPPCVSSFGGPGRLYKAAMIHDVKVVYFANDLSLGISPFALPADSPARLVFPMWQFSGTTDDGRELEILWPAMQAP